MAVFAWFLMILRLTASFLHWWKREMGRSVFVCSNLLQSFPLL